MIICDLTFILGGIRSGKSAYAEQLAIESGYPVTYIATAYADDDELAERIERHQVRRPANWNYVHEPIELAYRLRKLDHIHTCVLIDCLTLWLANLLCPRQKRDIPLNTAQYKAYANELETALCISSTKLIIVSNEIGLGVIPNGNITRWYVDELGELNQRIAKLAMRVILVIAGLPISIKEQM
ncbi:MAG: bifunctional adenosylcobinamide kinase/adenosylcobinamide-phosphate guanylyltransferase [Burkholderia sp.]|nr:bifunctional adenosylcobinamide kinase/adenosylcobinamide-phosphate guanylyltransferase [Burkholderia sp.]